VTYKHHQLPVLVADGWEDGITVTEEGQRKLKNLTQKLVQSSYCVEISYQKHVYAAWKSRWVEHKNSAVLEIDSIALDCFFFCSCLKSCVCFLNHSLHDPSRTSYFQMPILTIQTCSGLFPTLSIWLCGVTRKDWKSRNSIMNHPVISTKFNCRSVDKRHSGRNTI